MDKQTTQNMAEIFTPLNMTFLVVMAILAAIDLITYYLSDGRKHKVFRGEITGIGILGTFLGIVMALYWFDVQDITGSVPKLLEGMKTAFFTSVCGMALALCIALIQTAFPRKFAKTGNSLEDKITEQSQLLSDIFGSLQKSNDSMGEQMRLMRSENTDSNNKTVEILEDKLTAMNDSLGSALEKLTEGANKQIIEALNNVIKDFNNQLEDSFGGNLARLSDGVDNLLEWQTNYKSDVKDFESGLEKAIISLQATSQQLVEIEQYQSKFKDTCDGIERAMTTGETLLAQNSKLVIDITSAIDGLNQSVDGINNIPDQFDLVIAKANESAEKIATTHAQTNDKLQSQITQATEDAKTLRTQLEASTNRLNDSLISLTDAFSNKYGEFLNKVERLMSN